METIMKTKEQISIYNKERYKNDAKFRKRVKETSKRNDAARRLRLKIWWYERRKSLRCLICGEKHIATLDFHHKDPLNKVKSVRELVRDKYRIEKIEEEIAKCVVLCSNCHRKFHWKARNKKDS